MIMHAFHLRQHSISGFITCFGRILAVALFLGFAGLTSMLHAQAMGTIVGQVVDPSGASVKGAHVTIVESETGLSQTSTTDNRGRYAIPSLRPTEYGITIENPGFETYVQNGITLLANQSVTVDVTLVVGSLSQKVTVNANASPVDVSTPTLMTVIGQTAIEDLPLDGRAAADLIGTVAGVVVSPSTIITSQTSLPGSGSPSMNGSRGNSSSYSLDGANYLDEYEDTNIPFPFPDALQEFSVQTSNYTARYGENSGGVVNVVTKSGTGKFHGNIFEYNRNAIFNARNAFAAVRDPLKRNQFGGTIGGPVILPFLSHGEHRTFFFAGYQGSRIRETLYPSSASYVPTAAELTGDFSAFLSASNPGNSAGVVQNIDDPLTGTQFPGNIIPTSRLDPASLGLAKFLPVGTGNGEVAYTTPESQNVDEYIARIDHVISEKNSIHARFFEDDINLHASYSPVDIRDYVFGYHTVVTNVMVQDSNAFSPNLLNILTLTYSTTPVNKIAPQNSPDPATFGVMNIYQPPTPFIQNIAVDGEFTISGGAVGPFHNSDEAVSDDVTWVKGSHILSLGFGVENARAQVGDLFDVPGTFTFTNNVTNNAMASFMLGYLRTFIQGNGEFGNNENWYTDFYANDTWRVSSRLTLTYGLRYEPYLAWKEFNGRFEQFLPANAKAGVISQVYPNAPAGLVFRGDPGVPDRGVRGSMTNFAPRVGFAYDLAGNGRSSVRGGFGAFYDSHTASIIMGRSDDVDPFSPQINLTEPKGPFSNPLLGVVNPFPAPEMPSRNAAFPAPVSVIEYDPSRKYQVPVSYNYNLIVEQSFFSNLLFQVAYVGEHAIHDKTSVELNPSVYIPGSSLLTDARRIFPGYSTIIMDGQVGSVHYNSLQVTARQQATHNLYVLLAYTFSKDLDNIPNGGNNNDIGSDGVATLPSYYPNYQAFDYGPSGNDRRHNLVASYILHLPTFPRFSRRTRLLLGGWRVTGMVNLRSGAPLTVKVAQDISSTNLGNDSAVVLNRANSAVYGANSCVKQALAYCASWLNSADFALPASGTFGPPGKGQFEGPWLFNWNMGLVKDFKIEKRFNLEFRGEFFNVFNHVNKSNPNTTFGDAGFGTITAAGNPRIGQLALKLAF